MKLFVSIVIAGAMLGLGCASQSVNERVAPDPPTDVPDDVAPPPKIEKVKLAGEEDKINPVAYDYYVNGTIYEALGNPYQATENYRRALKFYNDSYEIRFSLAMNLYRMQRYDDALQILRPIDPEDADVWALRGDIYRATGDDDSAQHAYLQVAKQDSTRTEVYSFLATAYGQEGKLDSTLWAFQHMARLNPDNPRLFYEIGRLQLRRGELDGAEEAFAKSAELQTDVANIMSLVGLGEISEAREDFDSALAVYKRAVAIDPENIVLHRNLAGLYVKMDSLEQAARHALIESELAPLDRYSSRRLGMLYFYLDSLDRADSVFSSLVASGENNPVNHQYLGRIALNNDNPERAVEQFQRVVQITDSSWENWIDLGFAYQLAGKRNSEIQVYRRGLKSVPDTDGRARLMFAMAAAMEQNDQFEEAVETFEKLLEVTPDFDAALNYLGYMLADANQRLPYARELIERALAINPDNAAYLDSYGWVLFRQGEYEEARKHLERAVELDTDPVMFDHLGDTYKALGKMEEARSWWQKALDEDPDNESIQQKLQQ